MDGDARQFHFNLIDVNGCINPVGQPVNDRDQAFAVAKRLAIDIAETRKQYLGKGCFILVLDDTGREIHREGVDSAEKSG